MQLDALVISGLVGNWHSEIEEGDRERDFQHSLALSTTILPRTTTIHAQMLLPGKTKDTVVLDRTLLQLDISDRGTDLASYHLGCTEVAK